MKNILIVLIVSLIACVTPKECCAQFMVTSMVSSPAEGEDMSLDNLTDNIGVMYSMDKISAGIMMDGDDYNLVARYSFGDRLFAYGLMTEEEEISLGVGYALNVWNELYIEPSYLLDMESEDSEGELKLSLTYKF